MGDCDILGILRDVSLTPHLLEERRQIFHDLGATVLVNLHRGRVRSGRFPAGELQRGPDVFVGRGREDEVEVGLHLRQTGDDGVGDVGGTVEDASEMLSLSLKNLSSHLDRGKEVLRFVAVRVPLDLLVPADRPGVLYVAQPLTHKAATTIKRKFVVVGQAVDVGFVQAVLSKQVVDGGVVVIKPVLVLAPYATEDGQCCRLDCVPQLTPSPLHGSYDMLDGLGPMARDASFVYVTLFTDLIGHCDLEPR
ncbi:hypothetical protein SprV_0301238800 [Sparganum proliferum]